MSEQSPTMEFPSSPMKKPEMPTVQAGGSSSSTSLLPQVPEAKATPSVARSNSFESTAAMTGSPDECLEEAEVWLHVYHTDATTGFLNWAFLKGMDMPICHAGVEVFGSEWSFQYYEDTWDDSSISGVVRSEPKSMTQFEYQESISLGMTPLRKDAVFFVLEQLYDNWPANSYHLTHNNCIHFVQALVAKLKTPKPLPEWLTGIITASNNSVITDGLVDYGWSWARWYMEYKHKQEDDDTVIEMVEEQTGGGSGGYSDANVHPGIGCVKSAAPSFPFLFESCTSTSGPRPTSGPMEENAFAKV